MLSAAFFISVFSSVIWIFYALSNRAGGGISDFVVTTAVVVLPVFILWIVFGYVYQYISASVLNKNMYSLFKQMKKNQDYTDLLAKVLLEADENIKDNIMLSKFDIFIADMNELLAEILKRCQIVSSAQVDDLWVKVKNGGKWAFGRMMIEASQNKPNLPNVLLQKALADSVLGGMVLEFCSRYQSLIASLEKHDKERLFLNIVETGVLGKVFSLLASPADSIRQNRDLVLAKHQMSDVPEIKIKPEIDVKQQSAESYDKQPSIKENRLTEGARRLFVNTFKRKESTKSEEPFTESEKDPLSVALAKSFGAADEEQTVMEPHFSESTPSDNEELRQPPSFLSEPAFDEEEIPFAPEDEPETQFKEEHKTIKNEEKEDHFILETNAPEIVPEPILSAVSPELENGFQKTQSALADIKQEWEDAKQRDLSAIQEPSEKEGMPEPKINNDNSFSYPFGGWMDAENYHN